MKMSINRGMHKVEVVHVRSGKLLQYKIKIKLKNPTKGFPGGAVVENLPANAGDTGSSPGLGRSHMPQSGWAR